MMRKEAYIELMCTFGLQEALPVRLKGLHFVNTPSWMDKVLALMRPFMKKELMDVMQLHNTTDSFVGKHIDRKFMPNEYGGEAGSLKELQSKCFVQAMYFGGSTSTTNFRYIFNSYNIQATSR